MKNNLQGTSIPRPSPAFSAFPVTLIRQKWFLSAFKNKKLSFLIFPGKDAPLLSYLCLEQQLHTYPLYLMIP